MTLRFLGTGDLQVGNWKQFNVLRPDGHGSRLHHCLQIFRLLRKEAERRNIDKVLINGDIFEKNGVLEVEVFDAVYQEVEKMHSAGIDVVMNIGNHDVTRAASEFLPSLHSLRIFNRIATTVETPRLVWKNLYVIPWMADSNAMLSAIDNIHNEYKTGNMALALHVGITGAKAGTGQALPGKLHLGDIHPERFQLILLSDYHHHQWIGKNAFYLGSPMQHSFGETHKGCVWEISIGEHNTKVVPIPTNRPEFHWISIRHLSDAKHFFRKFPKDYFRVQILPAKRRIESSDLQKLARQYGCLVQVENAPVYEKGSIQQPVLAEGGMHRLLRDYVKKNTLKERHRLSNLGNHILNSV